MAEERLPRSVRDILERLGPAMTLRLVAALGGTTVPVPMRASVAGEGRYRQLCDIVGKEAATALCREYGGTNIYIPACKRAVADRRDRALIADRDAMAHAGLSEREIVAGLALKYQLSDRHVWRVLQRVPGEVPSLFRLKEQARLL